MFRLVLLVAVAALLVWRLLPSEVPELAAAQRLIEQQDTAAAIRLAQQRIAANPADGRNFLLLANLHETAAPANEAPLRLAAIGERFWPLDPGVRLAGAALAARQGRLDAALTRWGAALTLRPALAERLHPTLLRVIETAVGRDQLMATLATAPSWWPAFFRYLADAAELDIARRWFAASRANNPGHGETEWRAFLSRLEREGVWKEAYFVWLGRVSRSNPEILGNLYNGGFEASISNIGFGWRWRPADGVSLHSGVTQGLRSERALQLNFAGVELHFNHLWQPLMLPPGRFQLRGLSRSDELRDTAGLRWVLSCLDGDDLGWSRRFAGNQRWREFRVEFDVPEVGCETQRLTLETAEDRSFATRGELWFDSLLIRWLSNHDV